MITGASRGLGAGMALEMARLGMRLALCARHEPQLGIDDAFTASVDVSDEAAVMRFAADASARLGTIDLWINNAGVLEPIAFVADLPHELLMRHLAVNVGGVLNGSRAYIQLARVQRRGVLINISSGAAQSGYPGWGAYAASKAAVDRLTECIQLEEASRGLRAYSVAPGVIDTDMQRLIRNTRREVFPLVDRFIDRKRRGSFNSPAFVAQELLSLAFESQGAGEAVTVRLPEQHPE